MTKKFHDINDIASLGDEIHQRAWADSQTKPIGRAFAVKYLGQLAKVKADLFLQYCFNSFDSGYCDAMLLSLPELWERLTLRDWEGIAIGLSPRPRITRFDPTGKYSDLEFFVRSLNLDFLAYTFSITTLSREDKMRLLEYCEANADSLIGASGDFDFLDGISFCSADRLRAYRSRLLMSCPLLLPKFHDANSLRSYAHELLK